MGEHYTMFISKVKVKQVLRTVNAGEAAGSDGVPGKVLEACADQLTGVVKDF